MSAEPFDHLQNRLDLDFGEATSTFAVHNGDFVFEFNVIAIAIVVITKRFWGTTVRMFHVFPDVILGASNWPGRLMAIPVLLSRLATSFRTDVLHYFELFWTSFLTLVLDQADLGEDVFGCGGPDERFGGGVPVFDVGADAVNEVVDRDEGPASDGLSGDDAEPDSDAAFVGLGTAALGAPLPVVVVEDHVGQGSDKLREGSELSFTEPWSLTSAPWPRLLRVSPP
jgi:hypothetical protein